MRFRSILLILLGLYLLYLIKTAAGINLSQRYSGWDFLKWPVNCRSFSSYCVKSPGREPSEPSAPSTWILPKTGDA